MSWKDKILTKKFGTYAAVTLVVGTLAVGGCNYFTGDSPEEPQKDNTEQVDNEESAKKDAKDIPLKDVPENEFEKAVKDAFNKYEYSDEITAAIKLVPDEKGAGFIAIPWAYYENDPETVDRILKSRFIQQTTFQRILSLDEKTYEYPRHMINLQISTTDVDDGDYDQVMKLLKQASPKITQDHPADVWIVRNPENRKIELFIDLGRDGKYEPGNAKKNIQQDTIQGGVIQTPDFTESGNPDTIQQVSPAGSAAPTLVAQPTPPPVAPETAPETPEVSELLVHPVIGDLYTDAEITLYQRNLIKDYFESNKLPAPDAALLEKYSFNPENLTLSRDLTEAAKQYNTAIITDFYTSQQNDTPDAKTLESYEYEWTDEKDKKLTDDAKALTTPQPAIPQPE